MATKKAKKTSKPAANKTVKKTAKKAAKKSTPKKAVKKTSPKKVAKKATKKVASKKVVKKVASKKVAPKKVTKKKVVKSAKKAPVKVEPRVTTISPYLTFPGNCEEAFNFYKSVFGGDFQYIGRFNEMPPMEGQPLMPDSEGNKIMHVSLPISKETVLMGSDSSEAFGHATVMGNNFSISINAGSTKDADRLFNGLAASGTVTMPLAKTFWGAYFGMLVDKFGIQWMVNFDENPMA